MGKKDEGGTYLVKEDALPFCIETKGLRFKKDKASSKPKFQGCFVPSLDQKGRRRY
jgi:hypothetical protein